MDICLSEFGPLRGITVSLSCQVSPSPALSTAGRVPPAPAAQCKRNPRAEGLAAARYETGSHTCYQMMCVHVYPPDLGFQAAQRVVSSPPDVALSVLRDTVQNLPTVAKCVCVSFRDWPVSLSLVLSFVVCLFSYRSVSRVAVTKELRSEVTHNQRQLRQYGMEEGDSVVLLNGIVLQLDNTDIFRLAPPPVSVCCLDLCTSF